MMLIKPCLKYHQQLHDQFINDVYDKHTQCVKLYHKYLINSSEFAINVSFSTRNALKRHFDSNIDALTVQELYNTWV